MAQQTSASKCASRMAGLLAAVLGTLGAPHDAQAGSPPGALILQQSASDSDGDGLSNTEEDAIGSNPNDRDSDDDGLLDGEEPESDGDADDDGLLNVLDPDSDNDGLWDGLEAGTACADTDTRRAVRACKADSDAGDSKTDPLDPDTDGDGLLDGEEDYIHNGIVDEGERDPTNGPRTGGDESVQNDDALQGGGFACSATHRESSRGAAPALMLGLALTWTMRRRRRTSR
jgi:uncharacterized protein (TIGR03382 family)